MKKNLFICQCIVINTMLLLPSNVLACASEEDGGNTKKLDVVNFEATSLGVGLGVRWGDGTLTWNEGKYSFLVESFGLAEVGLSRIEVSGHIENLKKISDFVGTYFALEGGIALGGGGIGLWMINQNGTSLYLSGTSKGLWLSVPFKGITIRMK